MKQNIKKFNFTSNEKYLFIRVAQEDNVIKEAHILDDFKDFCHYCGNETWKQLKPIVINYLNKKNIYILDGNDVLYYIIQHPTWKNN